VGVPGKITDTRPGILAFILKKMGNSLKFIKEQLHEKKNVI
jgi:hypothetical protein